MFSFQEKGTQRDTRTGNGKGKPTGGASKGVVGLKGAQGQGGEKCHTFLI